MVRQILFLIISFLLLSLDLSSQCAMCKAVVEANLEAAGKSSILMGMLLKERFMQTVGLFFVGH